MAAPAFNQLELDSNKVVFMSSSLAIKPRSNSYGSSSTATTTATDDSSSIPDMIMSTSLQSFHTDCDDADSLSSSWRSSRSSNREQSPTSPRSIFQSYWSSPSRKSDEDEVMERLRTLQLPSADDDDVDNLEDSSRSPAKIVQAASIIEPKSSFDDASIDYQAPSTPSPRRPRRQILPTPPPPTAVSSSLIMPRKQHQLMQHPEAPRELQRSSAKLRPWSSAASLMMQPHQSCLRKSRYSCSAIVTDRDAHAAGRMHVGLRNDGRQNLRTGGVRISSSATATATATSLREELKKSVSFFSTVSVREFAVPADQRRSQKGWSNYFA